eukprot:3865545-Amphidinium_carterae.1
MDLQTLQSNTVLAMIYVDNDRTWMLDRLGNLTLPVDPPTQSGKVHHIVQTQAMSMPGLFFSNTHGCPFM